MSGLSAGARLSVPSSPATFFRRSLPGTPATNGCSLPAALPPWPLCCSPSGGLRRIRLQLPARLPRARLCAHQCAAACRDSARRLLEARDRPRRLRGPRRWLHRDRAPLAAFIFPPVQSRAPRGSIAALASLRGYSPAADLWTLLAGFAVRFIVAAAVSVFTYTRSGRHLKALCFRPLSRSRRQVLVEASRGTGRGHPVRGDCGEPDLYLI